MKAIFLVLFLISCKENNHQNKEAALNNFLTEMTKNFSIKVVLSDLGESHTFCDKTNNQFIINSHKITDKNLNNKMKGILQKEIAVCWLQSFN